jgi:hypothetical protein
MPGAGMSWLNNKLYRMLFSTADAARKSRP